MCYVSRMGAPTVLLLIPPLTQLNTPYPSTAYLAGFLRSRGLPVAQADLGIEMVLRLFSRSGLLSVFERIRANAGDAPGEARQMLALEHAYLESIDPVIGFLQGRDPMLAPRLARSGFLPEGPRFAAASLPPDQADTDRARRRATLYLEDLADLIQATISPHFALNRYAEHVARSASSFDPLLASLAEPEGPTERLLLAALWDHMERVNPSLVGITVPFPGNVYGALRIAKAIKGRRPDVRIALGGGYANTELRRLTEPRLFDLVDYVTLDDGERPLLCLIELLVDERKETDLRRTFLRDKDGKVVFRDGCREPDFGMVEAGCPTYQGLALDRYLSILDTTNPMHRLWSEGHWNKLTVAHGCYWKQCTFCDVGLDYIGRYDVTPSAILADRVERLAAETGQRGFHFVDEAAPPSGLKGMAIELLERRMAISWWGNIRFEEAFTPDLCRLLAASGCIAVTAGLEAASDRLLASMKKGITVEQTALVAAAFHQAGILVHAYLMYGCPGETTQETIDALERVRQLFAAGVVQSGFWHRFTATAHSPVGLNPAAHGITILGPPFGGFAENDLIHEDPAGESPDWLAQGLRTALLNYMEGRGLQRDVRGWFGHPVARPRVPSEWISRIIRRQRVDDPLAERRFIWIGGQPVIEPGTKGASRVILPNRRCDTIVPLPAAEAYWLLNLIGQATPGDGTQGRYPRLAEVRAAFPLGGATKFDRLLRTAAWRRAREAGLLLV